MRHMRSQMQLMEINIIRPSHNHNKIKKQNNKKQLKAASALCTFT